MLNVPAVLRELIEDERIEPARSVAQPSRSVRMDAGQARAKGDESDRLRQSVVIALRDRILDRIGNAFPRPTEEINKSAASFWCRGTRIGEDAFAPQARQRADRGFLTTIPLNPAKRRVPVDERVDAIPKCFRVSLVA